MINELTPEIKNPCLTSRMLLLRLIFRSQAGLINIHYLYMFDIYIIGIIYHIHFLFMRKFDLEERLISFSVQCIEISKEMQDNKAGIHLAGQLIRSSTSTALNYGEAQSRESRKDFVHKMKIVLKELRESHVCLRIVDRAKLSNSKENLKKAIQETDELISIFVKSISTAENKL